MAAAFGFFTRTRLVRAASASGLLLGIGLCLIATLIVRPAALGKTGPDAEATPAAANVLPAAGAPFTLAALDLPISRLGASDIASELEQGLRAARARGARFAVLPGPAQPDAGQGNGQSQTGETIPGPTTMWAGEIARSLDMWLALPVFERSDDPETGGNPFLTMVLVDPRGKVEYTGRAVLPNPAFGAVHVARGSYRETLRSVDVGQLRVGLLSGSETMTGVMRLSDLGADIIFVSSNLLDADGRNALVALARKSNVNLAVANRSSAGMPQAFIVTAQGDIIGGSEGGGWIVGTLPAIQHNQARPVGLGLPSTVPRPKRTAALAGAAELGRRLFIDPRLSEDETIACASCHRPSMAFTNGDVRGHGVNGRQTKRNVPSLINVAYRPLLRWDGYASSLENFIKYPIIGAREMNLSDLDRVVRLVNSDPDYRDGFARVFGAKQVTFEKIELVLADYMRTLTSANSPFDRFHFGGDSGALSPPQQRGFELFTGKAGCAQCHPAGERDTLLTDYEYHDLGVGWHAETASYDDIGLGGISTAKQSGRFLTPSLRDVARTAPYMHDGSIATLKGVVEFLDRGGNPSPDRDPRIVPLGLSEREKTDLVAFLESLTGDAAWNDLGKIAKGEGQ
jgi:cytochrome c peroxidase